MEPLEPKQRANLKTDSIPYDRIRLRRTAASSGDSSIYFKRRDRVSPFLPGKKSFFDFLETIKIDEIIKNLYSDGKVKSSLCKARES